jgi:RNA polymerase sigma factor (sigma-70 family)
MFSTAPRDDAELVSASLAGDRNAFGQIVSRYQALVCSLAYSATGSIAQSEDMAQETFITAWKNLQNLRETSKLRAWLCGIARNLINHSLGRQEREPSHGAEPLDAAHEAPAAEAPPSEQAINREEQAILWRSLQQIPEIYREPLILFYREHQSIERVATALELSEDNVKQRLSRGRKLLQEHVAAFVAGALEQTTPGNAFTLNVLGALPALTAPAAAATLGAGASAAKGGVAAKAAASATFAGAILGPVVGIIGGWLGYKVNMENAESARERQFLTKLFRFVGVLAGLFCLGICTFVYLMASGSTVHPKLLATAFVVFTAGYCLALLALILWGNRAIRRIRVQETAKLPAGTYPPVKPWYSRSFEYRSRWTLLGLPLIHVQMESKKDGKMLPAVGWIAVGNLAYGVLFAFGGVAVGTVSIGGAAVGLVAIGGGALGLLSIAGVAVGIWANGGAALGYLASGGGALGWLAADGGAAVAHSFAVGGSAAAEHANDEVARAFIQHSAFFQYSDRFMRHAQLLIWLPMTLIVWQLLSLRRTPRQPGFTRSN